MKTSTYPLTDRLLDGKLEEFLRSARAAGESHETITYRLRSEHDIKTSKSTVYRWCLDLGIDTSPSTPSTEAGA